jgi:thymidylate kinase
MIIYLEGVDGTGKTTLANALADRIEQLKRTHNITKVVKNGESLINTHPLKPNRLTENELLIQLYQMTIDLSTIYICDRGPISDIIYRAYDEYPTVTTLENFWVFWMAHQHIFICVHCDSDKSEELMKRRGDDNPVVYTKYQELRYWYKQICPLFNAVKYDIDTMGHNMSEPINKILARLWTGLRQWKVREGK